MRPDLRALGPIGLATLLFGCAFFAPDADDVAARVGDRALTLAQLDERARQKLFDERTRHEPARVYDLRTEVLEEWIEELVLTAEAERRGLSIDGLIAEETPAVGDEEVARFFEDNRDKLRDDLILLDVAEPIREHLEQEKLAEAVQALVEGAGVEILLDPPRVAVAAHGPALGPASAPITIVEFSDFECPFCRQAGPILDELRRRYPDDVRIVYRHLPLENIHPRARAAAEASACADDQDAFWPFHDLIFEDPGALAAADLRGHAEALGLALDAYDACVAGDTHTGTVTADVEAAREAGIASTPAFVINGVVLLGAQPVEAFERVIERELRALAAAP